MSTGNTPADPHAGQPVFAIETPLAEAAAAVVMLHGRGGSAEDILGLSDHLATPGLAMLAPQARANTWYPHSFLVPTEQNEPYLSSALALVGTVVEQIVAAGIPPERIALLGFSQGACLASEYAARNTRRYGGVIVFTGGVIGADGSPRDYPGSLDGTPVFIGGSDVDVHIPLARLEETAGVFETLGGDVDFRVYPGMGHTINADELAAARAILTGLVTPA